MKARNAIEMMKRSGLRLSEGNVRAYQLISIPIYMVIACVVPTLWHTLAAKLISSGILIYVLTETIFLNWLINQFNPYNYPRSEEEPCDEDDDEKIVEVDEELEEDYQEPVITKSRTMSNLEEHKDEILKLRKEGMSYENIAKIYTVSRTTITKFIKSYNN